MLTHLGGPISFCYQLFMARAIPDNKKSATRGRGRPRTNAVLVGVRLEPPLLAKVDALAKGDDVSRPEAIRRIIERS